MMELGKKKTCYKKKRFWIILATVLVLGVFSVYSGYKTLQRVKVQVVKTAAFPIGYIDGINGLPNNASDEKMKNAAMPAYGFLKEVLQKTYDDYYEVYYNHGYDEGVRVRENYVLETQEASYP